MIRILAFLATLCVLAANALPVLENNTFLTEQEHYLISNSKLNFMQAYATCKRNGYTLAMERSAEDTVALNAAIAAAGLSTYDFWIGGFRQNSDDFVSEWIWLETGEAIDYSHWSDDERTVLTCLMRRDLTNHDATWLSEDCTTNVIHFICQKDVV